MTTTMPTAASFNRDDTVLVLFPNSDLRTAKLRPALVVQADQLNTGLAQIIVAMITSRLDRAGRPSRVKVSIGDSDGRSAGLLKYSVIMTDNLATVLVNEIDRQIGSVPMIRIDAALRHTLRL